jgi:DNA polymerase I-like protein with 3'-5' exonuclease and polymerase domains
MGLLPVITKMEMLGVYVDVNEVQTFAADMAAKAAELREQIIERLEPFWNQAWRREFATKNKVYMEWKVAYDQRKQQATVKAFEEWWKEWRADEWEQEVKKAPKDQKSYIRRKRDEDKLREKDNWLEEHRPAVEEEKAKKHYNHKPKERGSINIDSNSQLTDALAEAGIHLPNMRKETLADAVGQHELLDHVLEYKKYEKLIQMAVLDQFVSAITGMIHCTLNQIGTATGRMSCKEPNLQQIPARTDEGKRMRKLFKALRGRKLVVADYAAIELVIIAAESRDEALLTAIRDTSIDLHCWTMAKFLNCPYPSIVKVKDVGEDWEHECADVAAARERFEQLCTIPELNKETDLTKWVKKLRDVIKTLTYGIAYGLSEFGLARKFHFDPEDGKALIALFFAAYPKVKEYLDKRAEEAWKYGYSSTAMGRKRFFKRPAPVSSQEVHKAIGVDYVLSELPPQTLNSLFHEYKRKLEKEFFFRERSIKRQGANHAIQGASADMTKLALLNLNRMLYEEGFPPSDYPRLPVHDEILCDVSERNADAIARLLEKAMEDAAHEVLPKGLGLKIKVEANVLDQWEK